jgi:2,5-diketo-D-gluconate reductase A
VIPALSLNSGGSIPQLGLGTWLLDDSGVADLVVAAAELGYRHVDTAAKYHNESGVGEGIRRSGIDRAEFFVTTKLDGEFQGDDRALAGIEASLGRLGFDYVDLLLIHWPLPQRDLYVSTWRTFEKIAAQGKAKAIGVSNFTPAHLDRLASETATVPAVNQVQLNPFVPRAEERKYHAAHGILTESWAPLDGNGARLLDSPVLRELAKAHGKTAGQIALRWHIQNGLVAIPKTANVARLSENLHVFDFELSGADLDAIGALSRGAGSGVNSETTGH